MALLKKVGGQPHEMADEVANHLKRQELAIDAQDPVAQGVKPCGSERKPAKAERNHRQEIAVGAIESLIDDELHLKRRGKGRNLQRERQDEHLDERRLPTLHA